MLSCFIAFMIIGIDASRANHAEKTGVEIYAFHIIQELKKSIPSSVGVVLYSREPLVGELAVLPAHWQSKVLSWPPKKFWTQIRLSMEMLLHSPDVLFIPAHVAPLIHPKKTVMTVHDVAAYRFPSVYTWFERWYSIWSAKQAVKTLWRIIVPSRFTRDELVRLCRHESIKALKHKSLDASLHRGYDIVSEEVKKLFGHVRIVPHAYDTAVFRKEIKEDVVEINRVKEVYGITKPYILTVGRLEEKKNTWRLVKAFDQMRTSYPDTDVQLVLAGKPGVGYKKVVDEINKSVYRADIVKTGWVDESHIPYLLAGAEAFVFPSLYEGFGLPVLEAMAIGVPVIASRENSLEEVGGHAIAYVDAFHIHELMKKMHLFIQHQDMRQSAIAKGYSEMKRFSWQTSAEATKNILIGM